MTNSEQAMWQAINVLSARLDRLEALDKVKQVAQHREEVNNTLPLEPLKLGVVSMADYSQTVPAELAYLPATHNDVRCSNTRYRFHNGVWWCMCDYGSFLSDDFNHLEGNSEQVVKEKQVNLSRFMVPIAV